MNLKIAVFIVTAVLMLTSCSRDPIKVRDLLLGSIHSDSCQIVKNYFESGVEPTCPEIEDLKSRLVLAFGSTNFDLSYVTPQPGSSRVFLGSLGHGVEFIEYFGIALYGSNKKNGEINIFFCSRYSFRICRVEFIAK